MTRAVFASVPLPAVAYAMLAALCLLLYLPGFTTLPPFDRDEARFAQASTQMLETGDYVDIRFQDEARLKKPVGIYWLQSLSTNLLGSPESRAIWTYRVPSLVGAIVAVLLTAWVGARLFGPMTGAVGAAILASVVVLGVEARMAKTDAVLLATVVASQAALALLYLRRNEAQAPGWALPLLFWASAGIGVLIKGPMVALVSGTTVAALALWDRRASWLRTLRPVAGILVVAAIAAPWLIAITIKTHGSFFAESVGHDLMGKVAGGQEGKGLPPGFYLVTFLVTFAPWAFLALAAVPWVWKNRRDDAVRFCICWIVPTWIAFEAVPTKLLHYTLPVFPAIALLSARALLDRSIWKERAGWWFAGAAVLGLVGFGGLAAAIGAVPWLVDHRIDAAAILAGIPSLFLFALALWFAAKADVGKVAAAALAAAIMLYGTAYALVLPAVDGIWISRSAAALVVAKRICDTPVVASAGYSEPSLVFLLGTATRLTDAGGAAEHLKNAGPCGLSFVESRQEKSFREALGSIEPEVLGRVEGINYNNGRRTTLTLYGPGR